MLRIANFIATHFWIFFLAGIILGVSFPIFGSQGVALLQPLLLFGLTLIFLKLDLAEILKNIRDIRLMAYITILFLIIIPTATYFIFSSINQTLAVGFLLLAAMPPGASAPVLTDLIKGNAALSSSILIVCSLLAPFTVPMLFKVMTPTTLALDTWSMFWTLAMLIFIPILLSVIIKKFFLRAVTKSIPYFSAINVLIISFFVYTAIATQQSFIVSHIGQALWQLVVLYIFFIILHIIGYGIASGRSKSDKIAVTISKAYMNNGMAIVIAVSFFPPPVVILAVLSEIPWSTLLTPFRWSLKYLR